jgi:hypothetical protein
MPVGVEGVLLALELELVLVELLSEPGLSLGESLLLAPDLVLPLLLLSLQLTLPGLQGPLPLGQQDRRLVGWCPRGSARFERLLYHLEGLLVFVPVGLLARQNTRHLLLLVRVQGLASLLVKPLRLAVP